MAWSFNERSWRRRIGLSTSISVACLSRLMRFWLLFFMHGLMDGKVLYRDPDTPHRRTAGWLIAGFCLLTKEAFKGGFFNIPESGVKDPDISILSCSQRKSAPCLVAEVGFPNERNFKANKHEVRLWSQYGVLVVIGINKYGYPVNDNYGRSLGKCWDWGLGFWLGLVSSNSCRGEGMYLVIGPLLLTWPVTPPSFNSSLLQIRFPGILD